MYPLMTRLYAIRYYILYESDINRIIHIKNIFMVSPSQFYYWLNKYGRNCTKESIVELESVNDKKEMTPYKITNAIKRYIVNAATRLKCTSMKNIKRSIMRIFNTSISIQHIYRILKEERITYKNVTYVKWPYTEKKLSDEKKRLKNELGNLEINNIISYDESSVEINMQNNKGWSKKNTRCLRQFKPRKVRMTLGLAINRAGVVGFKIVKKSFNGAIFKDFLDATLLPIINNNKILLDNATIHKCKLVKESLSKTTNKFVFNIPYHPQTNPVEYIFGIMKQKLRKLNVSTEEKLQKTIEKILKKIPVDIFNNCYSKSFSLL